jgi:hypothetical protein
MKRKQAAKDKLSYQLFDSQDSLFAAVVNVHEKVSVDPTLGGEATNNVISIVCSEGGAKGCEVGKNPWSRFII